MTEIGMTGQSRVPPAPDHAHALPYTAALDGIRGLAIAGVVGTHFGLPLFATGGNGVDLFFVLSGFLITSVLLRAKPRQSLPEFYWNRFTRLFPALALLCATYAGVAFFASGLRQAAADVGASITYVANWTRAYDLGVPKYIPHVWSLSLEEQFYLVYPPVLLLLCRLLSRNALALLLLAVAVVVVIHRAGLGASGATPDRLYNGLDTHSDGLAIGAALALWSSGHRLNRVTAVIARCDLVAALAVPILFAAVSWPHAVILTNLVAAWLIFAASHPDISSAGVILCARPVVWLGRLSYGIYLWHFPVLQYFAFRALWPWAATFIVGIPLSVALAALSYYGVELPALRRGRSFAEPTRRTLGSLSASLTLVTMVAGSAYFLGPLIARSFRPAAFAITDYAPRSSVVGQGFNVQPGGLSVVWLNTTDRPPAGLSATWNGRPLATYPLARRIAVFVPRDFIDTVGRKTVEIAADGRVLRVDVDITPRD